jgi:hypothetical protein
MHCDATLLFLFGGIQKPQLSRQSSGNKPIRGHQAVGQRCLWWRVKSCHVPRTYHNRETNVHYLSMIDMGQNTKITNVLDVLLQSQQISWFGAIGHALVVTVYSHG